VAGSVEHLRYFCVLHIGLTTALTEPHDRLYSKFNRCSVLCANKYNPLCSAFVLCSTSFR